MAALAGPEPVGPAGEHRLVAHLKKQSHDFADELARPGRHAQRACFPVLLWELGRWEKLSAVWHQRKQSMRQPDHAEITADFLVQDAGPAVVQRTWPDGADFAGDCPVCGRSGALTGRWRQATEQEVARLSDEARAAEATERAVDARNARSGR
jgi:hypothetical protein